MGVHPGAAEGKRRSGERARRPARTYRDLVVWQKAMRVTRDVYELTRSFPREELFGLTSQLRRCAVSIPSNIAEGFGRRGAGEYLRFLLISRGSVFELETQLQIALDVSYLGGEGHAKVSARLDAVERMLEALIRKVGEKRAETASR